MDIRQLILNAELAQARQELIQGVKKSPGDSMLRTQLFQVLVFLGEWDKAMVHLKALPAGNKASEMGHGVYSNLIRAEKERMEVAELKKEPSFLPKRPIHADRFFQARDAAIKGQTEIAAKLFKEINGEIPQVSGTLLNRPFSGFFNTDPLAGNFIEIMEYERYLWIPIETLREITVTRPQTLLDTIWARGSVTTWSGLTMGCFFPVLYPLSHHHTNDKIKMGQMTEWHTPGKTSDRTAGQQVFQIGETDVAILELGTVEFNLPTPLSTPLATPIDQGENNDKP